MVKCTECAFLASSVSGGTTYLELDSLQRKHLDARESTINFHDKKNAYLYFVDTANLCNEYGTTDSTDKYSTLPTAVVISKEKECEKFILYKVGYSPKEMAERVHNSEIIRIAEARLVPDKERGAAAALAAEERAEDRRRDDKAWQGQQRNEDIKRQEEYRKSDRRDKIVIPIVTAFVTTVVIAVVTYIVTSISTFTGFPLKTNPPARQGDK